MSEERCARCGHSNDYHPLIQSGQLYADSPCYESDSDFEWCGCPSFVPPKKEGRS